MTDPTHHPQAELDELASAYLDGQASFEEAGRVARDPELLARVEHLRQARNAIRLPGPPVDHEHRERAIAAALVAAGHEPLTAPVPLTAVGDLAEVRTRRQARRGWLPAAGIAAAIAIAALLLPQLGGGGDRDDTVASKAETFEDRAAESGAAADSADGTARDEDSTASFELDAAAPTHPGGGAAEDTGTTGGAGGTGPAPTGGDPGATTTTTEITTLTTVEAPLVDLGTFHEGDAEALKKRAQAEADGPSASTAKPTSEERAAIDACLSPMEATAVDQGGSVLYAAVADVGGEGVVALVVQLDGGRELRTSYLDGCTTWFTASLGE